MNVSQILCRNEIYWSIKINRNNEIWNNATTFVKYCTCELNLLTTPHYFILYYFLYYIKETLFSIIFTFNINPFKCIIYTCLNRIENVFLEIAVYFNKIVENIFWKKKNTVRKSKTMRKIRVLFTYLNVTDVTDVFEYTLLK